VQEGRGLGAGDVEPAAVGLVEERGTLLRRVVLARHVAVGQEARRIRLLQARAGRLVLLEGDAAFQGASRGRKAYPARTGCARIDTRPSRTRLVRFRMIRSFRSVTLLLALGGCGFQPAPGELHYALDKQSVAALADAPQKQRELAALLEKYFGTRDQPRYALLEAWKKEGVDPNRPATELGFAYPGLRESAEIYRTQCMHCHGVEGGGDGATSLTIDPKPRDFRKGIFKYTAVKDKARPRREDLEELLERGVYGTAMPSFARLSRPEREGLVDYVRLLAIRGEVEGALVASWKDDEKLDDEVAQDALATVWERWQKAREKVIACDAPIPPDTPALRARGRELYFDAKRGNCVACHGPEGRGDGAIVYKTDAQGRRTPAYKDDWGFDIVPRDLTSGVFHGGSRPIDVYRRIYAGINGTPMPGLGETKGADGERLYRDEDLWALVHFVRALSERAE
jgi:mono/diheme cytochrome c family protein